MSQHVDPEAINVSYEGGPYASRYSAGEPDMGPTGYRGYPSSSHGKSHESLTGMPAQMPFTLTQPGPAQGHKSSSPATIQPLETSYSSYQAHQQFPRQLAEQDVTVQSMSVSLSQKTALVQPQTTNPNTFLPLSILVTILFCPLTGAAAIYYSLKSRNRLNEKHYGAAEGYGCIALCFVIISLVIGVTFYITVITMAATRVHFVPFGYGNGNEIG